MLCHVACRVAKKECSGGEEERKESMDILFGGGRKCEFYSIVAERRECVVVLSTFLIVFSERECSEEKRREECPCALASLTNYDNYIGIAVSPSILVG